MGLAACMDAGSHPISGRGSQKKWVASGLDYDVFIHFRTVQLINLLRT